MRGNEVIDYSQLGLNLKVYSCQIYFNIAQTELIKGNVKEGLRQLDFAEKYVPQKLDDGEAVGKI